MLTLCKVSETTLRPAPFLLSKNTAFPLQYVNKALLRAGDYSETVRPP